MMKSSLPVSASRAFLLSMAVVAAACSDDTGPTKRASTGSPTEGADAGMEGEPIPGSGGESGGQAGASGSVPADGSAGSGGAVASGGLNGSGAAGRTGGASGSGGASGTGGRKSTGSSAAGAMAQDAGADARPGVSEAGVRPDGGLTSGGTITLVGNKIVDVNGNTIIARGPENIMAGVDQIKQIQQAAALGANAMRMLFTLDAKNGMTPAGFDSMLAEAVKLHMLVWVSLYMWDSDSNYVIGSGLGGGNFYSLTGPAGTACSKKTPASCYLAVWSRQWLKDLMNKYRSNIILDAMQEFIGPDDPSTENARVVWATAAKANIQFFRSQGFTNPLEVMANFQGRDLYGIVEYGDAIRAVDTLKVGGDPQTMFGWQAYWSPADGYYPTYQGALLLGKKDGVVSGPQAVRQYASKQKFPIQIGIDNINGDTAADYKDTIDAAAEVGSSWLWWSWKDPSVQCPVSGATCQSYVTSSQNGFKGTKPLSN